VSERSAGLRVRLTLSALALALPALGLTLGLALARGDGVRASQGGDPGARVFEARCAGCHALTPQAAGGAGPQLAGLEGRRLAGDPAFDYSPALRSARDRGERWDAARLERFLIDPEALYPGLWMGDNGVNDAVERRALVGFLTRSGRAAQATP